MSSFFLFMGLFLFHVALTSAIDVREMSIDEYISFVNPPAVYKYENQFGQTILCVKFTDQISVKYSPDNITRGLKKAPTMNLPSYDSSRANFSTVRGVKSECPEATVATREIKREDVERAGSVRQFLNRGRRNRSNHIIPNVHDGFLNEFSIVRYESLSDPIFGIATRMNLWRPNVDPDAGFSLSQFWITNFDEGKLESIEAGWMVYPSKYHTAEPTFFVYWTSDSYNNGCYDLECPGYVVADGAPIEPGRQLGPVSEYGGAQYEFGLSLHLEEDSGIMVWALYFAGTNIGHWPASLFVALAEGANRFSVGGEVAHNSRRPGPMTATGMGSGHFAAEGDGFAAYTRAIQMFDDDGDEIDPPNPLIGVTKSNCYTASYVPQADPEWGKNLFFGGPGGGVNNPNCVA